MTSIYDITVLQVRSLVYLAGFNALCPLRPYLGCWQDCFPFWSLQDECTPNLTWVHFNVTVGLRSPFPCLLYAVGHAQFLGLMAPFIFKASNLDYVPLVLWTSPAFSSTASLWFQTKKILCFLKVYKSIRLVPPRSSPHFETSNLDHICKFLCYIHLFMIRVWTSLGG